MANAAIVEVKQQLKAQGGQGNVWVENWNQRFSQLGSLRDFLESRNDVKVIPGAGKKFTVKLVGGGAKMAITNGGNSKGKAQAGQKTAIAAFTGNSKGAGKGKATGGRDPLVAEAIREIKGQLIEAGGVGTVWVDNWGPRFSSSLGSLRDFIASRPDKFEMLPGPGNKFMVALPEVAQSLIEALGVKQQKSKDSQNGSGIMKPKPKMSAAGGQQKQGGYNPLVAEVIREIKTSLQEQGGSGKVWIENWKARFGSLAASPREFIESRPDKFTISYEGDGKAFTIALAGAGGAAAEPQKPAATGTKRKLPGERGSVSTEKIMPIAKKAKSETKAPKASPLAAQAEAEAVKQLRKPSNTEGKIWINDWNQKYKGTLGTLREFLESKPEKFIVLAGEGSKYTVALIE